MNLGGREWVGLTTDEKRQKKLLLMHQSSLCEFQGRKTKSGGENIEDALWGYKYREFNRVHVFISK